MSMPTPEAIVGREAELQRLRDCRAGLGAGRSWRSSRATPAWARRRCSRRPWRRRRQPARVCCGPGRPLPRPGARSPRSTICSGRPSRGSPRLAEPQRRALAAALLLETASDPVDPRQVGLAALSLLDGLPGPVLLAVDDWHWLDAASATVLSFVLRRLEPGGAKVIATVRSGRGGRGRRRAAASPARRPGDQAGGGAARRRCARAARPRADRDWMPPPALARLHEACRRQPADGAGARPGARGGGRDRHPAAARPPRRGALARTRARRSGSSRRWRSRRSRPSRRRWAPPPGLEAALAADVLVARRPPRPLRPPPDRGGGAGAHAAGEWRAIHAGSPS